tara:strand:+ start:3414 stop:3908 length:495 start_codon:yes stop_codon:yes gene_type:complete
MSATIEELLKSGQMLLNTGNPKGAMTVYDKILEISPNHIDALIKKGNILGKLGKYDNAIIYYDRVLEEESQNILALLNKGLAYHYIGQYQIALDCYEQVLMIKPRNVTALYNKASSLVKSKRIEEGLKVLSDVIEIDFSCKVKAKFDIDFTSIQKNNEFRKIVL